MSQDFSQLGMLMLRELDEEGSRAISDLPEPLRTEVIDEVARISQAVKA